MGEINVERLSRITLARGEILVAEIKMQGMIAENQQRLLLGDSLAYTEKDFLYLINEHRLHHNGYFAEMGEY